MNKINDPKLQEFHKTHPWPDHSGVSSLFKFMSINVKKPSYIEHLFIEKKLYHSLTDSFNDPFEGKSQFTLDGKRNNAKIIREHLIRATKKSKNISSKKASLLVGSSMSDPDFLPKCVSEANKDASKRLRVTCFTTSKDNLLFWSHYADSHRGFCVEFDASIFPISFAYKVKYSNDFPQAEYPVPENSRAFETTLIKSKVWEYENEYRTIFIPGVSPKFKDDGVSLPIHTKSITNVYLGAEISKDEQETLLNIIEQSSFDPVIWKASLSKDSFELIFTKIN